MLDFSSTAMGFNSFSSKPQLSLDDPKVLDIARNFQGMFDQHRKLEVTNDPTYLRVTKDLLKSYSECKRLEEIIMTSHESSLGPLHAYGPSSSKSPHHSSSFKSYHDSPIHHSHSLSSMSSSSTRPPSSSSS